jgi:hypothetical protein
VVNPSVEPIKLREMRIRTGCRKEENKVPPNPENEVTEKTSNLSISAPLKPKKKNLIHRTGDPRRLHIKQPKRSTPNQMREEKKERAEQRFKLKIKSRFIIVRLINKSENNVKTKKKPPKPRPTTRF